MKASPEIVEGFSLQTDWCARMHSDLYATILEISRDDIMAGGVVDDVVAGFDGDPVAAALALRFMGGLHRLVLMGLAPDLAAHYPSVGGEPDPDTIRSDLLLTVASHVGYLRDGLRVAPQTNEIGRSGFLLPGLLDALAGDDLDVRLLEIGSSAGLNLLLDRYRYELGSWSWGDVTSAAVIEAELTGDPPEPRPLSIVERRGCDLNPLDVTTEEHQLRLLSFVWADQEARIARTRGAIAIANGLPPTVDNADCGEWLEQHLSVRADRGVATVVQHSVMWQYLPNETRAAVRAALHAAGERATNRRPLIHVAFEPNAGGVGSGFSVTVTRWPDGEARTVASGHAHGAWIRWG